MKIKFLPKFLSLFIIFAMTFNFAVAEFPEGEQVCTQDNLVLNGDFEYPDVTNESGWELFSSGTDWNVSWVSPTENAPENANLEIHGGVNGWLPSEGLQYAELDTDYGSPAGGSASVNISQEIETIVGAYYSLSYDFSARPNTDANENEIIVKVNGNEVSTAGPIAGTSLNQWSTYNIEFVATSSVTLISFEDAGTSNSEGTFLDNISVTCDREAEEPEECLPVIRISEDGREDMVKVSRINPRWVPSIAGTNAKWVWNNASIPVFPDRQEGGVFTVNETFNIIGNPEDSEIKIAADNVYSVVVNGNTVYGNPSLTPADIENFTTAQSKFSTVYTHTIPANLLNTGSNTIEIRAVNSKWGPVLTSESTATNPAGLMYALTVNEDCDGEVEQENDEPVDEQTEENDESEPNDPVSETEDESVNTEEDNNQNSGSSSSGSRASGRSGGSVLGASTEGEVLGACVPFSLYHKKGDVGGEVAKIQEFLNEHMNAGITVDGVYGETTVKAVHAFQQKYFEQIIRPWVPSFMARTTGKWYKTTRMMANKLIDCPEAPVFLEDPKIIYEVKWEKPQVN